MSFVPHDHRMWAAIGLYSGGEGRSESHGNPGSEGPHDVPGALAYFEAANLT